LGFEKDREKLRMLAEFLDADIVIYRSGIFRELVDDFDCIVAYMPTGIVIRSICPYLRSKWIDPAVVVVDKPMRFAIPLLGAHHGANAVAEKLRALGLTPVITTSMEFSEGLCVGIGCRKGISSDEILKAINSALDEVNASLEDVRLIATIELKKNERGLIEAVDRIKKPLMFVSAEEINRMELRETKAVMIGVKNVAEACALFYSKKRELILPKRVYGGVTVAIAR
jgi:cobalt-precorrin 5A hydrolase